MARPRRSFQEVFLESLDNAGRTALGVNQSLREGKKLAMEEELQPDRVRAGTAAANQAEAQAGKEKLGFEGLRRQKGIQDLIDAEMAKPAEEQNVDYQNSLWDRANNLPSGSTRLKRQQMESEAKGKELSNTGQELTNTGIGIENRSRTAKAGVAELALDTDTKSQGDELKNRRLAPVKTQAEIDESRARADRTRKDTALAGQPKPPDVKPLTQGELDDLTLVETAAKTMNDIREAFGEVSGAKKGPIMGRIAAANPYDVSIQKLNKLIDSITPALARGVFREVGVLTDKDMERYKSLLPQAKTDPKVAEEIFSDLQNKIQDTYSISISNMGKAGRDISNFDASRNLFEAKSIGGAPPAGGGRAAAGGGLDRNDPRVKAALAEGYSEDEVRAFMGKKR